MGLFDGLFGSDESAKFDRVTPFENLPGFLRGSGERIGTGSFDLFEDLINKGETAASEELFSRSRTRTLDDFNRATGDAGLALNRSGLASSGQRDKTFASLSLSLLDRLSAQDAQRSERQRGTQLAGAQAGLGAINSLSQGTALIPQQRQPGLFDGLGTSLVGIGAGSLLGGVGGGLTSAFGIGTGGVDASGRPASSQFGTRFKEGFGQGFGDVFSSAFSR